MQIGTILLHIERGDFNITPKTLISAKTFEPRLPHVACASAFHVGDGTDRRMLIPDGILVPWWQHTKWTAWGCREAACCIPRYAQRDVAHVA